MNQPRSEDIEAVIAYHERTKHHPRRYARSLGYMDWDTQPDPFRRFEGANLLPLIEVPASSPGADTGSSPDRRTVSQMFYDSLALSAWKRLGSSKWSLRVNPSSGALHPTEGYLLAGPLSGLSDAAALHHYAPSLHALETRRILAPEDWERLSGGLPDRTLIVGLTSIHWRESWKYGERAFRYCQHDAGHAVAGIILAAAHLGWRARLVHHPDDDAMARLLGVSEQTGIEAEHPETMILVDTSPREGPHPGPDLGAGLIERICRSPLLGHPNRLSRDHHPWEVIDDVAAASRRRPEDRHGGDAPASHAHEPSPELPSRAVIRGRRSAVAMDGTTRMTGDSFRGTLRSVMESPACDPGATLGWPPAVHLILFVHRVDDVPPGLYCLVRRPAVLEELKRSLRPSFDWRVSEEFSGGLPLYLLAEGDCRDVARQVSCGQEIASDGAFAAAMLAEFEPRLERSGPSFYRAMHWEAGAIGQVLYLAAESAGTRATGIGCFFDDALHAVIGLRGRRYQDIYHFTIGGAVEDPRIQSLPAYGHGAEDSEGG